MRKPSQLSHNPFTSSALSSCCNKISHLAFVGCGEGGSMAQSAKLQNLTQSTLAMHSFSRHYHLEVQVNDVIQLNLCEITNLKHDLACTEEKMVYQSYEKSRDMWVRDSHS